MVKDEFEKEREKQIIKQMRVEEIYKSYIKKISRGEPIKIRIHHLFQFYRGVKHNDWASSRYIPDYNQEFIRRLSRKIAENPTSKIKVVADWDIVCDFCPKRFYRFHGKVYTENKRAVYVDRIIGWHAVCDNSEQIKDEMEDYKYYYEGIIDLNSVYNSSELLSLIYEARKPNI
jgi:hypothetical protein